VAKPAAGQGVRSCARVHDAATAPKPVATQKSGSTVALAKAGAKTFAYVADEDDQAVHVLDVDGGEVGSFDLGGKPSQLVFTDDGRLVVAVRDLSHVTVLEPTATGTLEDRCTVDTDDEPVGLAVSPDGARLFVATGWGRSLSVMDARSPALSTQFRVALGREPRALLVSDDGTKVYVAHAMGGQLSIVDLGSQRVDTLALHAPEDANDTAQPVAQAAAPSNDEEGRPDIPALSGPHHSAQGYTLAKTDGGRILIPQALVDSGDIHSQPGGYGGGQADQTEVADVAVLDAKNNTLLGASLEPMDDAVLRSAVGGQHQHEECLLPRSSVYDPSSHTLLVGCFGTDAVVALDALAASPTRAEKRRWSVPAGPSGIALDGDKQRAVVWSQFERTLSVLPLQGPELVDEKTSPPPAVRQIVLAPTPRQPPMAFALGRALFHAVGDERISHDGRACASCHPDGRDDGLTWATPVGPRRSIMLAGRVARTAPFSWSGTEDTLRDHLAITFQRLKGRAGLKGLELDALVAYVSALPPPPQPLVSANDPRVKRGDEIFHSDAAGCATCHTGTYFTDDQRHDVSTKDDVDKSGMFNTPTLRFVGGTGPYFHDGRYKTLRDLLSDGGRKMGSTQQLSHDDLEALEAYLRSI
jgi:DNA-binding beta-propeller fold protein YncE